MEHREIKNPVLVILLIKLREKTVGLVLRLPEEANITEGSNHAMSFGFACKEMLCLPANIFIIS